MPGLFSTLIMDFEGGKRDDEQSNKPIHQRILDFLRTNIFLVSTLSAVVLGVVFGLVIRLANPNGDVIVLIGMPGEIFMRCLRMLILPMMIATIITGSATLSGKAKGKMAGITFSLFIGTSFLSTVIGLLFVVSIHPGRADLKSAVEIETEIKESPRILDTFLDLFRNAFPENLVEACIEQGYTSYEMNGNNSSNVTDKAMLRRKWSKRSGTNSLGLIVFCVVFGGALGGMGAQVAVLRDFFAALDAVIMKLVFLVMWITPVGVFSLLCARILIVDNILGLFHQMALFIATVLSALTVELFVCETLLYLVITRKNPFKFMFQLVYVGVCSFVTAASSAVMPLTLRCLEENCKIDRRVTRFVVPVGVTVNMNGTAVFITIATVFIAQMNDIALTAGDYFAVLITATAVSVAATSVPSAALFLMVMTLSVIGAPVSDVSLLFTMEWLLDRARTVNNCLGDAFASAVVDHLCFKSERTADPVKVIVEPRNGAIPEEDEEKQREPLV